MDQKLRMRAIVVGASFVLFVCLIAFATNLERFQKNNIDLLASEEVATESLESEEIEKTGLRDFMNDPTFFDQEDTSLDIDELLARQVSIQVLSIQKDLRISILDVAGNLVPGETFEVDIENAGTYTDDDEDGIIYIPSISAGEYYVSLKEHDGYKVPDSTIKVHVKANVEYQAIGDIAYLIKTEEDIDPSVEDVSINAARVEADDSETSIQMLPEGAKEFGIDVSKWNQEIDWEKVANAGVTFAIIRCGYRGAQTGTLVEDPYFLKNIEGATDAGIDVGVYFFTQAVTVVEAVEEASMVLTLVNGYDLTYPIYIDTENAGTDGRANELSRVLRTDVCEAFVRTIANAEEGYTAGIYGSKNWLNQKVDISRFSGNAVWLAEYRDEPTFLDTYHMWQYTSRGKIDGITGNVDFNLSYMDMKE